MATLKIKNLIPNVNDNPKTYLSQAVNTGDTNAPVAATNGFTATRLVQIGETGNEVTEIKQATAIPSNLALTVAALDFGHAAQAPVYEVRYNQVKIYRKRAGTETNIATIGIQIGSWVTVYIDTSTLGGDTYASSFYNSITGDETPKSAYIDLTGFAENTLLRMRQRAKDLYKDTNGRYSDLTWTSFLNEAYEKLYIAAIKKDENYALAGPLTLSSGVALADASGTEFTIDPTTRIFKWLWVSYDGITYVKPTVEDMRAFDPNYQYSQAYPKYTFTGLTLIVRPTAVTGVKYYHYPKITKLSADADVPIAPMDNYDRVIIDGAVARAFAADKNLDAATMWKKDFMSGEADFLEEIADRQVMDNRHIEITDDSFLEAFGDDSSWPN